MLSSVVGRSGWAQTSKQLGYTTSSCLSDDIAKVSASHFLFPRCGARFCGVDSFPEKMDLLTPDENRLEVIPPTKIMDSAQANPRLLQQFSGTGF
ncbi:MAG: hypothetical protein ABF384_01220 [Verrucomicrobiales bacterium]